MKKRGLLLLVSALVSVPLFAHIPTREKSLKNAKSAVLADIELLNSVDAVVWQADANLKVGVGIVDEDQKNRLSQLSHSRGGCAGFEHLKDLGNHELFSANKPLSEDFFVGLREQDEKNKKFKQRFGNVSLFSSPSRVANAVTQSAVDSVSAQNIEDTVRWLSTQYPSRFNRLKNPNVHVEDLRTKLIDMANRAGREVQVDLIAHSSTPQKSVRARVVGTERPSEIVILGGHLDSINQEWGGNNNNAPGADDNASGSAAILEAFRIILSQEPPKRTTEFMWYAGEESGLLGSAEIAKTYKSQNMDVIGVMQLDMVLYPGSGELTFTNITDFTSGWLQKYLLSINDLYVQVPVQDDKCGYACSDHASWYRQGFASVFPFESQFSFSNPAIHTKRDLISSSSSFAHAAVFAKLAIGFMMDLGNSELREP